MRYPTPGAYSEAVQNPRIFFKDSDLQARSAAVDARGLPIVLSGGFACTYRFVGPAGNVAVRCFHTEIPNLFDRYAAISAFLGSLRSRFFVDFKFSPDGVMIGKTAYPVVRMEWVEGETMLGYVRRMYRDSDAMAGLRRELLAFADEAKAHGFAHGDVQPRNLMITPENKLRLVDYDGMFVPGMKGLSAANNGHPNFQSPLRTAADFGPGMDDFSVAVIDLSLEALQHQPELFHRFNDGENLLLSKEDFENASHSSAFKAIGAIPGLRPRAKALAAACALPVSSPSRPIRDLWTKPHDPGGPTPVWVRSVDPPPPPALARGRPARAGSRVGTAPKAVALLAAFIVTFAMLAYLPWSRQANRQDIEDPLPEWKESPPITTTVPDTTVNEPEIEGVADPPVPNPGDYPISTDGNDQSAVTTDPTIKCPQPSGRLPEPSIYPAITGYVEYIFRNSADVQVSGRRLTLARIAEFDAPGPTKLEALLRQCRPEVYCIRVSGRRMYTCSFPNGGSFARMAILHGAARAAEDANDADLCAQKSAFERRVGVWATPSPYDEAVRSAICE